MRGIQIPQQDFALKMPEGLMREEGHICGTLQYLRDTTVFAPRDYKQPTKVALCLANQ